MPEDKIMRKQLVKLLSGSEAHASFEDAIKGLPKELRGKTPKDAEHSPWQLVEHLRIAQSDILEFSRDGNHKSPKWPDEYWPKEAQPPTETAWDDTVAAFRKDLKSMCELVDDPNTDLFARIPHGDGQTIFREALLVADHSAYHVGALVLVRRLLGAWK